MIEIVKIARSGRINIPKRVKASMNLSDGEFVSVDIKKVKFVEDSEEPNG